MIQIYLQIPLKNMTDGLVLHNMLEIPLLLRYLLRTLRSSSSNIKSAPPRNPWNPMFALYLFMGIHISLSNYDQIRMNELCHTLIMILNKN